MHLEAYAEELLNITVLEALADMRLLWKGIVPESWQIGIEDCQEARRDLRSRQWTDQLQHILEPYAFSAWKQGCGVSLEEFMSRFLKTMQQILCPVSDPAQGKLFSN